MKIAVISGAAAGIGAATARQFKADGYQLVLGDMNGAALAQIAHALEADHRCCDVSAEADVTALIDLAVLRHGRVDCIVNNAGVLGALGPIGKTPAADFKRAMAVMCDGVFYGLKHGANAIGAGGGVILNTASIAGLAAWSNHSYTAAKHAVVALTRSAAVELAPRNIRVNAIAPGNVITNITIKLSGSEEAARARALKRNPLPHICSAEDIAKGFAYLASPAAAGITGHVLVIDSGLSIAPVPADYHSGETRYIG